MQYTYDKAKQQIAALLNGALKTFEFETSDINVAPQKIEGVDLAVSVHKMAKELRQNPVEIAQRVVDNISLDDTLFDKVTATHGYVNFRFDQKKFTQALLSDFEPLQDQYGSSDEGTGKTVVIDYSAPNIAKPFSVGHLRSTIIGQALKNIYQMLGYNVIGDNHIGDWGTQFGKLMVAYKKWGNKQQIDSDPIKELLKLYVKFHAEAEADPALEDEARAWFKRLESGDPEARELWIWFKDISWQEFERIYAMLGVEFDEVLGESFYNDQLQTTVKEVFDKGLANWEATKEDPNKKVAIVWLKNYGIKTPLLIQKSDGASLYATRDLATAMYRIKTWKPAKIIYVVGGEQRLYFQQWIKTLELMGYNTPCEHVWFGLVQMPEGKMSTRKGRVIFLEDVLNEAITKANEKLKDQEIPETQKQQIAEQVGVGAVKYADLSHDRRHNIQFDWKKMLNMSGNSGPYLQYQVVRINSILTKANVEIKKPQQVVLDQGGMNLLKHIAKFNEAIRDAQAGNFPHIIAQYLFELAKLFSAFYTNNPILKESNIDKKQSRLYVCKMTATVLKTGLKLLGIESPTKM